MPSDAEIEPPNPIYLALKMLDELNARRSPGPWWQKSCLTTTAPPGCAKEMGELLCYFDDEGGPRFWNWDTDGLFVVALENAWPLIREELRKALTA